MMIKAVVEVTSSRTDINGNRYHFAKFYNPLKGNESVSVMVNDENHARNIAGNLVESVNTWDDVLTFKKDLPVREFHRAKKFINPYHWEGSDECKAALDALYKDDELMELKRLMAEIQSSLDKRAQLG